MNRAILEAGLGSVTNVMTLPITGTYDPSILNNILDTVAENGDIRMKADVFTIVSGILEGMRDPPLGILYTNIPQTATAIGDHMYRLLRSNPAGISDTSGIPYDISDTAAIIDYLEDTDLSGTALTNFIQQLWADGKVSEIGMLLTILAKRVPQEVNVTYNDNEKDNASDLGYLMGAISAGLDDLNADKKAQINLLAGMLAGVLAAVPWIGGVLGFGASELVKVLSSYEDSDIVFLNILNLPSEDLCTDALSRYNTVVNTNE